MADNTYDFRISQPAYTEALRAYQKMETALEEEAEKQKGNVANLQQQWEGEAPESLQNGFNYFLEEGKYGEAYAAVKAMRTHMEGCLPEIKALLARCEGFPDQLESDTYVEPPRPAGWQNAPINGGILSINYGRATDVMDACDRVLEKNRKLTAELEDVIRGCSGLIEGTEEDLEALEAASRKLNRIANYRDSLQAYKAGVRALEFDMKLELTRLSDDSLQMQKDYGISAVERAMGKEIYGTGYYSYMDEEEMGMLLEKLQNNGDTAGILKVAYGIFAKDTDRWTDQDAEFIARTWDYAIQSQNIELIEEYAEQLMTGEYSEPKDSSAFEGKKETGEAGEVKKIWNSQYWITGDAQRVQLVMEKLDSETQGEAYYTLNRLNNLAIDSIRVSGDTIEELTGLGYCEVKASVEEGLIRLEVYAQARSGGCTNQDTAHNGFTVYDVGKVINREVEQKLLGFKYDTDEVERLRRSIISDTDVEFAGKFYAGDYAEAFQINPEGITGNMWEKTAEFLIKLEDMESISEKSAGTAEMEDILNALLYTDVSCYPALDRYYHDDYLERIKGKLKELAEGDVAAIMMAASSGYDDEELKELVSRGKICYSQYALWEAVHHLHDVNLDLENTYISQRMHDEGGLYMQISDLQSGVAMNPNENSRRYYSFDAEVKYSGENEIKNDKGELLSQCYHITITRPTPKDMTNDVLEAQKKKLAKELKELPVKATLDAITEKFNSIPQTKGIGTEISIVRALFVRKEKGLFDELDASGWGEWQERAEKLEGVDVEIKKFLPALKNVGMETSVGDLMPALEAFFRYQGIAEELNQVKVQSQMNNYGDYIRMDIEYADQITPYDKDAPLVGRGIQYIGCIRMKPDTAYNICRLERDGIDAYLTDVFNGDPEKIRDAKKKLLEIPVGREERDAWEAFLYGKGEGNQFKHGYRDQESGQFIEGSSPSMVLTDPAAVITWVDDRIGGNFGDWLSPVEGENEEDNN